MKTTPIPLRRFRTILDGCLIIFVMLLLIANVHQVLAGGASLSSNPGIPVVQSTAISIRGHTDKDLVGSDPVPNLMVLDNNTLAAMFAAENSALTSPQYLSDLPLIIK